MAQKASVRLHGIMGLAKIAALETAESGITANSICSGWVRTELVERQIEAKAKESGISIERAATNPASDNHPSKQFAPRNRPARPRCSRARTPHHK